MEASLAEEIGRIESWGSDVLWKQKVYVVVSFNRGTVIKKVQSIIIRIIGTPQKGAKP